jgi:HSP90 family molecular chaperone
VLLRGHNNGEEITMDDSHMESVPVTTDMGHLLEIISDRVFNDPLAPLREYIANARDASIQSAEPQIRVYAGNDYLQIADAGCGMTRQRIQEGFTRVAGHFAQAGADTVGMFGLGVLSAFMISQSLEVETRSAEEPGGWKLKWRRGEPYFSLTQTDRQAIGTDAKLQLLPEFRSLATESDVTLYVRRTFALFTIPIYVGNNRAPVNARYQWFAALPADDSGRLVESGPAFDVLQEHHRKKLIAAYVYQSRANVKILLGIPETERKGFGLHAVSFFSKGILIKEGVRAFYPEHLAFIVGAVDHPQFALQISREGFRDDEAYRSVRESMEFHVLDFLQRLSTANPRLLAKVMRTHGTMLLAHAQRSPTALTLFRDNYAFDTPIGQRTWDSLLRELNKMEGDIGPKTLYVFTSDGAQIPNEQLVDGRGLLVLTTGHEFELLKQLASGSGVELADSSKLLSTPDDLPVPFHDLARRVAPMLGAKGIPSVEFFSSPDQELFPACFRLRSERKNRSWNAIENYAEPDEDEGTISVDALLLNTAHPMIQELAGRCREMSATVLSRAANVLYSISALQSPLRRERIDVTNDVVMNLITVLGEVVGGRRVPVLRARAIAKCFVALPYAAAFDAVWHGLRVVLQGPPFYWLMIRGDQHVEGSELLIGILQHIDSSSRFIADVSGLNANVLVELGMMLGNNAGHTLMLCDTETFQRLPSDLKGQIPMIYPLSIRDNASLAAQWFASELAKFPVFISMHGQEGGSGS